MCAKSGGLSPAHLCMTCWNVASCHQFRTKTKGRNNDLQVRHDIWRAGRQLHLRELVRIKRE